MTTASVPFEAFESIARLSRDCVITEKIDGTNGQIYVGEDGLVMAGSRNRWLGLEKTEDAFGFCRWVKDHEDELRTGLGPGRHFGEWWGAGIQRRYGLAEKRFSLFNSGSWTDDVRPKCCHVVPVLYQGPFSSGIVDEQLALLERGGSVAAPGFMKPEGVCIWHEAARVLFKKTLEGDGHKFQKAPRTQEATP